MPENFLVPSKGTPQVDVFMARKFQTTDWTAVAREVEAGEITAPGIIEQIQALEPLPEHPSFDLEHRLWVLQEKLRMALRKTSRKSDLTKVPCGCGRPGMFHVGAFYRRCVACEEIESQIGATRSRGNCWYLSPGFDVATRSWGMLSYDGNNRDMTVMFFAAVGWPTYMAALEDGLLPWTSFWAWMWRHYQDGMPFGAQHFPWDKILHLDPPLSPADWRTFTREQLTRLIEREGTAWI